MKPDVVTRSDLPLGAAYDSTGSRDAHSAAATAIRSPGSGDAGRSASPAAPAAAPPGRRRPGDPPRDIDQAIPPAARSGRCPGATIGQHRLDRAALGADTGDEERQAGRDRADRADLGRGRGSDHETHRPARSPLHRSPGDPRPEWLGGSLDPRVWRDDEVLEFAGAGVGGPAQDVGEAVGPLEERRDRLGAEVRADGHGVGAEPVEQGDRLAGRRRPDVAPLGVDDDRHVGRQRRPQALQRGHALRPERLEEREVRLDGRGEWDRRFEDQPGERLDTGKVSREAGG